MNREIYRGTEQYYAKERLRKISETLSRALRCRRDQWKRISDIKVRGGVLEFKTTSIKIEDETATAVYSCCAGSFLSKNKRTGHLRSICRSTKIPPQQRWSRKSGQWQILKIGEIDKKMQDDLPYYGSYATYDEAYQAALKLDPEQENPF